MQYDTYIEAIDNLEEIEKVMIKDRLHRQCCHSLLEICKGILQYLKLKKNKSTRI